MINVQDGIWDNLPDSQSIALSDMNKNVHINNDLSFLICTIFLFSFLFTCVATSARDPLGEPLPSPSEEEGATGGSAVFFRDFFRILSADGFTSSLCLASVLTSSLTLGAGDSESSLESRWWTGFHGGGSQEPTSPTASILQYGKGQFEDWARTHFLQGINA